MYNGLIEQFNSKYEEEEKNLLFLYKSKIGIAINSLNKNEDVVNGVYEYYKKVLKCFSLQIYIRNSFVCIILIL